MYCALYIFIPCWNEVNGYSCFYKIPIYYCITINYITLFSIHFTKRIFCTAYSLLMSSEVIEYMISDPYQYCVFTVASHFFLYFITVLISHDRSFTRNSEAMHWPANPTLPRPLLPPPGPLPTHTHPYSIKL